MPRSLLAGTWVPRMPSAGLVSFPQWRVLIGDLWRTRFCRTGGASPKHKSDWHRVAYEPRAATGAGCSRCRSRSFYSASRRSFLTWRGLTLPDRDAGFEDDPPNSGLPSDKRCLKSCGNARPCESLKAPGFWRFMASIVLIDISVPSHSARYSAGFQ